MTSMPPLIKRNIVFRVILGYLLALSFTVGIVFLAFTGLNKINHTMDDITHRLSTTRTLAQSIDSTIQQVRFYADRYQRFYNQIDLDQFNEKITDLKKSQKSIVPLISDQATLDIVLHIQQETEQYVAGFDAVTKLIMYQQSLLSTTLLKQELLVENQLSAIRINVGIIQVPGIYFSFGNARNSFELMRLYQSKYLTGGNEKYFVMFKSNYELAYDAFSDLINELNSASQGTDIIENIAKAKQELTLYYSTFVDIHTANVSLKKLSKQLEQHELEVTHMATRVELNVEQEYSYNNKLTQELVLHTQLQLLAAVVIAILINLALIFVVLRKIITPIFHELQELSNLDGLTKVANRRAFDIGIKKEGFRAKNEGHPLSLILCDVDYFKMYNDAYGHQMGDVCLQSIAKTINTECVSKGDFVARYGGEEFIIILPNTSPDRAVTIANNIKHRIEAMKIEHKASTINPFVTISLGVATMTQESDISTETLINHADKALYDAKRNNRNCVEYYSDE